MTANSFFLFLALICALVVVVWYLFSRKYIQRKILGITNQLETAELIDPGDSVSDIFDGFTVFADAYILKILRPGWRLKVDEFECVVLLAKVKGNFNTSHFGTKLCVCVVGSEFIDTHIEINSMPVRRYYSKQNLIAVEKQNADRYQKYVVRGERKSLPCNTLYDICGEVNDLFSLNVEIFSTGVLIYGDIENCDIESFQNILDYIPVMCRRLTK